MNLLIDNNDGLGQQDYTAWVDVDHLPKIVRRLNRAATMTAWLVAAGPSFHPPVSGARVLLQRADGFRLFTGYLATARRAPPGATLCKRWTIPACWITTHCRSERPSPLAPRATPCARSLMTFCPTGSTSRGCKTSVRSTSFLSFRREPGPSTYRNLPP